MRIHTSLRFLVIGGLFVASVSHGMARQRPDFSGGWTATKETPTGVGAAPSAVFGARFWLDQKGDAMTVTRPLRDTALAIVHKTDGSEVRTRIPGPMCIGDAGTITSVAWEGENFVHRIHGSIPPGVEKVTPSQARQVFKKLSADRIQVEGQMRVPNQTEPATVATVYTRMSDAPPAPPATPSFKTTPATLTKITWLGGGWAGTLGTSAVEERWTPAGGGSMFATSRTVSAAGAVTAFEYLCVVERNGTLVYTAMPNGRSPATDFTLTAIDETSATFENPSHDFPKVIRYTLKPDGSLEAMIQGAPGSRQITYTFKKQ